MSTSPSAHNITCNHVISCRFGSTDSNATSDNTLAGKHTCHYLDNISYMTITITCSLDLYLPPFLFILGLISNTLIVLVMRSRSFCGLSTSLYIIVNAITDSAGILVALPAHYIFVNAPYVFDSARNAHGMCSFFNVIGWGTSDLGILITVAMTTERAIAIKYPLKAHRLCTRRRATVVTAGLIVFEMVKISHFIVKSRVVSDTHSMLCDVDMTDPAYKTFYVKVWPWLHLSILSLSYSVVTAGNIVLFVNIRRSSKADTLDGVGRRSNGRHPFSSNKNRQVSLMLLIDSISLVLCTLPYSVVGIMMTYRNLHLDSPGGKNLPFAVTFYLLYLNRCLNFFLYCISGSRFRSALREIFSSSRSSALSRSATRQVCASSVSTRSREQHVSVLWELNSEKWRRALRSVSLDLSTTTNNLTLSRSLAFSILLASSSTKLSQVKLKAHPMTRWDLTNEAINTHL